MMLVLVGVVHGGEDNALRVPPWLAVPFTLPNQFCVASGFSSLHEQNGCMYRYREPTPPPPRSTASQPRIPIADPFRSAAAAQVEE